MGSNWANDLARGFGQGAMIGDSINERTKQRKTDKVAALVAKEQDDKLFNVEDKGVVGNFMWDKLGLGEPPKKTNKTVASPAATAPPAVGTPGAAAPAAQAAANPAPMSGARATIAGSLNGLAAGSATAPAPEPLPMEDTPVTPVAAPTFAAMTPLVEGPQMSPVTPQPSPFKKKLLEMGITV